MRERERERARGDVRMIQPSKKTSHLFERLLLACNNLQGGRERGLGGGRGERREGETEGGSEKKRKEEGLGRTFSEWSLTEGEKGSERGREGGIEREIERETGTDIRRVIHRQPRGLKLSPILPLSSSPAGPVAKGLDWG